jgi:L-cystine transport system substrate-binding protein
MKRITRLSSLLLVLSIFTFSFAAFAESNDVKTVVIGTEGAYAPFNYINEAGEPDGYDIAVAKALDELIPELTFTFEPTEWSSIFVALEAGKFDIIVSEIAWNEDRAAKYLFSDTPYGWSTNAIIFAKGRTDIKTIEDLYGKTVTAGLGSANTTWLENYNAENGDPIAISYSDGDVSKMLYEIVEGRVDATLNNPVTAGLIAKEQGIEIDWVPWTTDGSATPVYILYANNENGQSYKDLIEPALQTLLENGTLKALSEQYLGADYSTSEAALSAASVSK